MRTVAREAGPTAGQGIADRRCGDRRSAMSLAYLKALLDDPQHRFVVSDLCVVELESTVARRSREPSGRVMRVTSFV